MLTVFDDEPNVPVIIFDKGTVAAGMGAFILNEEFYINLSLMDVKEGESGREISDDEPMSNPFMHLAFNVDKKGLNVVRSWLDAVEKIIDKEYSNAKDTV